MLCTTVIKDYISFRSLFFSSSKMNERYQVWMGKTIKREAFSSLAILKNGDKKRKRFWKSHDAHHWCAAYNAFRELRFYWKNFEQNEMGLFVSSISAHAFQSSMESTWMSSFLKKTAADVRLFRSPNTPILFFFLFYL